MSSATTAAATSDRTHGSGRFWALAAVVALLVVAGLSAPASWLDVLRGDETPAPAYTDIAPGDPVRLAVGGVSGVPLVTPLVKSPVEPREALTTPPDDAPLVRWWDGSARAGAARGQTILIAHAAGPTGGLTSIADLAEGDPVELLTAQGTMRYEVASVRTFDPATIDRVGITLFKQDGGAGRLVMISAEAWDGRTYQRSVVVTATPLGQPA